MTDSFHHSLDAALERSKQPPLAPDDSTPLCDRQPPAEGAE